MLAIRLKRTGRKGHAHYRMIAQDSHRHPSSGKVAAYLGSFDPHAKTVQLDKEKIEYYLSHGAQPTNRVVRILKAEGVTLPSWVKFSETGEGKLRNPEKLRKNRPAEPKAEVEEPAAESSAEEVPAEPVEAPTEEVKAEVAEEAPIEEAKEETEEKPAEVAKEEAPAAEEPKEEAVKEEAAKQAEPVKDEKEQTKE